jgi:tripartite-type tricarboxylate transporter receptor subunit TctC
MDPSVSIRDRTLDLIRPQAKIEAESRCSDRRASRRNIETGQDCATSLFQAKCGNSGEGGSRMSSALPAFSSRALAFASAFLLCFDASSQAADAFYQGKVLTIVSSSLAGSSYDLYARLLAQYLPKYIPGHPTTIVQSMPGANGLISSGYMYNAAPRDGTAIASGTSTLPTYPLLHPDIAKIDVTKLGWIGSVTKDSYVAYVWHAAPVQSYEEAKHTQLIVGGLTIGAPSVDLAVVSNALFGTKLRIVTGYEGENTISLAMERGEVQGSFGGNYSSIKSGQTDLLRDHKIKIILQHGFEKLPDLPDVPLFVDQAKTPEEHEILDFMLAPTEFNKPFYAPPGVPADRLDILRRAFENAVEDPAFVSAATQAHLEVREPLNGEQLTAEVAKVAATPPAVVERIRKILASFQQ